MLEQEDEFENELLVGTRNSTRQNSYTLIHNFHLKYLKIDADFTMVSTRHLLGV